MKPYPRALIGGIVVALTVSLAAQRTALRERPADHRSTGRGSAPSAAANVTLTFQGRTRSYLVHVPASADGALVVAFHGGGETAENQEQISGLDALSDRDHFIVAYPEGVGKSWADGRGTTNADKQGVDDVGFAKAVVADIAKAHRIDPARVYATGPSNGGIFSNTLGCRASDTFAAVAPVIGTVASAVAPTCHPPVAVAIVGVQGVDDPVVPFNGGEVGGTLEGAAAGGRVESSRATQELWRRNNGCGASPAETKLPPHAHDGTSVTKREYPGCRVGASVVWYEIAGGGHRWPPHKSDKPMVEHAAERMLGVSSQNIGASEVIWTFFAAHPRR